MLNLNLPFTPLPKEYCFLLGQTLGDTRKDHALISDVISQNKVMTMLVRRILEGHNTKDLAEHLGVHGWINLRNHLVTFYISHQLFKKFPLTSDTTLIQDLLEFEERFNWMSPRSHSRLFMFGYYLKTSALNLRIEKKNFEFASVPADVDKVLRLSKSRTEKPDDLIIIVWHCLQKFGASELFDLVNQKKEFRHLYEMFTLEEKKLMARNFLNYSASITEEDLFVSEKI